MARFADRRGGADVYTERLALCLARRGHRVTVFCHSASGAVRDICEVREFPDPDYQQLTGVWRFAPLFYQRYWRRWLVRLSKQSSLKPDVIVTSLPLSSHDVVTLFPDVPFVYLPHSRIAAVEATAQISDSKIQRQVSRRLYRQGERISLNNAATTVRFTHGNERVLRDHYRLSKEIVFDIIPPAVEDYRAEQKTACGQPAKLVVVGRLVESKNIAWLLQQLAGLETGSYQLEVIGEGPQRSQLESVAAELGIAERVSWRGFCADMRTIYKDADLHLFPSLRESYGLVVLEAMAWGTPTLALKPNGTAIQTASDEIIKHEINGWLVKETNFRDQLATCLAEPDQLLQFGENGRQQVIRQNLWSEIGEIWEQTLERLVKPVLA